MEKTQNYFVKRNPRAATAKRFEIWCNYVDGETLFVGAYPAKQAAMTAARFIAGWRYGVTYQGDSI
jgi:hypothetical protein